MCGALLVAMQAGRLAGWPAGRSPARCPDFQVPGCGPEPIAFTGFCHKIQWSCSQFRSQACPEDIGGAQLVEQKCRVIAEQHRGSSFKKL